MKKVFLATSFTGQMDYTNGVVSGEYKAAMEALLQLLRKDDMFEVYNTLESANWKIGQTPEADVHKDLKHLDESEVFLALIEDKPSASLEFEIGYAVGKGKQVVLAIETGHELSYFNQGTVSAGLVTLITYDDAAGLLNQLVVAINAPAETLL